MMYFSPRRLLLIPILLLLAGMALCASPASPTPAPADGEQAEVRLRKLHLVRPDLIPYPIVQEIYC